MRSGSRAPARLRREPHQQVLLDGEAREDLASLRHVADARRARALGTGRARDVAPAELAPSRSRDGTRPMSVSQQRGLADAVAAEQRASRGPAAPRSEVAQDVAAAVVLVEPGHRQHR